MSCKFFANVMAIERKPWDVTAQSSASTAVTSSELPRAGLPNCAAQVLGGKSNPLKTGGISGLPHMLSAENIFPL